MEDPGGSVSLTLLTFSLQTTRHKYTANTQQSAVSTHYSCTVYYEQLTVNNINRSHSTIPTSTDVTAAEWR